MPARHYQLIWLLAQRRNCMEGTALTRFVRRLAGRVLERYNRFGRPCLGDRRRGNGAAATVRTVPVPDHVRERLMSPPDDGGVWSAQKGAAVMAVELGLASVAEQRGREARHAIGWRLQHPRPRHARVATPDEQDAFK